jgi:hypothetical protein
MRYPEPRFEFRASSQQASALLSELGFTLMSYAAPYSYLLIKRFILNSSVADPGSNYFWTPGFGMEKISESEINIQDHISILHICVENTRIFHSISIYH